MSEPIEVTVASQGWDALPAYVKHKYCMCPEPEKRLYSSMFGFVAPDVSKVSRERYFLGRTPLAFFCGRCFQPLKDYLSYVTVVCEECEKLYVPVIEPGTYPIRNFLCGGCNIPSRAEARRKRFSKDHLH